MKAYSVIMLILGATLITGCINPSKINSMKLGENWKIQQSSKVMAGGKEISNNSYSTDNWYKAKVPSTIMGILAALPEYAHLMEGGNYYLADKSPFDQSWWYRTTFNLADLAQGNAVLLQFDGLSYYANIWLNGNLIAAKDSVFGTFRRFEFDVTQLVEPVNNTLAVEIFRQQPGDFGHGFVDWNPRPLDANMGIWRDVRVKTINNVQIKNSFVRSKVNTQTLNEAWLTVGTQLRNFSNRNLEGILKLKLGDSQMEYSVNLKSGETKEVVLTSNELKALHLIKPSLWWCNQLGSPSLYNLNIEFLENDNIKAADSIRFGIREIESYFNAEGHRGFKLNGKEILIKGAGWTDDIFLRDTEETNKIQVGYVKDMGMNTIRFENIWGTTQSIYDLCDENGLLAMVGWSCQWEWENYLGKPCDNFGGVQSEADIALVSQYMHDQVLWLRNHPSIFVWLVGSDMLPRPALEKKYMRLFAELDNRPWLSAASTRTSELTGPTGVKMNGPYEYVGPSYWYLDKKNGGAFGFNTETGPGSQLPVIESIEKMIPYSDRWPLGKAWGQHCTTSGPGMNSMKLQNEVITAQYGAPKGFEDFVIKSHLSNYEAIRAMFEAFRVNRPTSTGIIQWMLNSAWPSLYWQVYDHYLVPTPAYYGVKKALQPLQLIYNYGDRSVVLSNETLSEVKNANAKISAFDINSKMIYSKTIEVTAGANRVEKIGDLPLVDCMLFLKMELFNDSNLLIADNFYWLSPTNEEFDWNATEWYYTPMKKYSDYSDLNNLKKVNVDIKSSIRKTSEQLFLSLELVNTEQSVAFFTELKLKTTNGEWVVPALFSDNYFTLLPGESKLIEVGFPAAVMDNKKVELQVSGWNILPKIISIE
jgi:exo-1,4-beta-D-glucosaminidase